jgi:hypothetical protein
MRERVEERYPETERVYELRSYGEVGCCLGMGENIGMPSAQRT